MACLNNDTYVFAAVVPSNAAFPASVVAAHPPEPALAAAKRVASTPHVGYHLILHKDIRCGCCIAQSCNGEMVEVGVHCVEVQLNDVCPSFGCVVGKACIAALHSTLDMPCSVLSSDVYSRWGKLVGALAPVCITYGPRRLRGVGYQGYCVCIGVMHGAAYMVVVSICTPKVCTLYDATIVICKAPRCNQSHKHPAAKCYIHTLRNEGDIEQASSKRVC